MTLKKYKLTKDKDIVECTLEEWCSTYDRDDTQRVVKQENVGKFWVSTVFLGIDHNFGFRDPTPILFETMIFDESPSEKWCQRYPTYQTALEGHNLIVEKLKDGTQELYGENE